jgi:hypothetical protein
MQTNTTQPGWTLRGRMLQVVTGLLLFVSATSVSASAVRIASMSWTLSDAQVVEAGETVILPNGTMSTGYTIEVIVELTDSAFVTKGTLRVNLTAFSPKKDSRVQKAGIWYVRGEWVLSDIDAPPISNPRYTPGVIHGQLQVELPFNPAEGAGDLSATLRLPQTTMEPVSAGEGRQPMRGTGILILDDKQGGVLTLDLKLWPRI